MPVGRAIARGLAIGSAAIAYAALAHFSNAVPGNEVLGTALAVGPVLGASVILAWRSAHRLAALLACACAALLLALRWDDLEAHFARLYLIQQVGINGLLCLSFGATLRRGSVPLCTRFAVLVHGPLPPPVARYTRSVTLAWALFFAAVTAALLIIYAVAPLAVWSAFANFCTAPLVVLMFTVEHVVRRRVLPQLQNDGFLVTLRVVLSGSPDRAATAPNA